jgi:putative oxidoreductase
MNKKREAVFLTVRLVIGGVFLCAGIVKIAYPESFAGSIAAYRLLPWFGNYLAAAVLPWLETVCGVLLITGWRVRGTAAVVTILLLVFMAALASTIVRGLDIDCGCFRQKGTKTSAWTALGRDALLLMGAITVLVRKEPRRSL